MMSYFEVQQYFELLYKAALTVFTAKHKRYSLVLPVSLCPSLPLTCALWRLHIWLQGLTPEEISAALSRVEGQGGSDDSL